LVKIFTLKPKKNSFLTRIKKNVTFLRQFLKRLLKNHFGIGNYFFDSWVKFLILIFFFNQFNKNKTKLGQKIAIIFGKLKMFEIEKQKKKTFLTSVQQHNLGKTKRGRLRGSDCTTPTKRGGEKREGEKREGERE
jgi:hypothetical protein